MAAPIHLSTTFERDAEGGYPHGFIYGRSANPNAAGAGRGLWRRWKGARKRLRLASGLAASSAILQALAPGDHVIAPTDVYHGMTKLLREVYMRWGLEVSFVDMTKLDEIKKRVRPANKAGLGGDTLESAAQNYRHRARSRRSRTRRALCARATTPGRRSCSARSISAPIWSMHATTKYLGGHSDVTGGVVIAKTQDGFF